MIISCQDALMHLCPATLQHTLQVPSDYLSMNDLQLDNCFAQLAQGHHVWVWQHLSSRLLINYLSTHYRFVKAAGGMVETSDGDRLMICRQGRWDLPKGMVEPGETLAQAALREVEEETGIHPTAVKSLIAKTYHIYDKYGGWHLKQTSWFAMEAQRLQPRPQTEEDIAQAVWVPRQECLDRLAHSFASLSLLARIVEQKENSTH